VEGRVRGTGIVSVGIRREGENTDRWEADVPQPLPYSGRTPGQVASKSLSALSFRVLCLRSLEMWACREVPDRSQLNDIFTDYLHWVSCPLPFGIFETVATAILSMTVW
jgi:hypothetical protein